MGHYGCGGVEAAFSSRVDVSIDGATSSADPAVNPVYQWITPIREIYQNSMRCISPLCFVHFLYAHRLIWQEGDL